MNRRGEFERDSSPERRQKWEEDGYKEIKTYCSKVFEWRYLNDQSIMVPKGGFEPPRPFDH